MAVAIATDGMDEDDLAGLVAKARLGDRDAAGRLFALVEHRLRAIARWRLNRLPPGNTLSPTDLVNEAFLKLLDGATSYEDRQHFLSTAARAMRQILADRARARAARKRGGGIKRENFDVTRLGADDGRFNVLDIAELLGRYERLDPRGARVVEMRVFADMSEREIADALAVTERTVRRDWVAACAWLRGKLAA